MQRASVSARVSACAAVRLFPAPGRQAGVEIPMARLEKKASSKIRGRASQSVPLEDRLGLAREGAVSAPEVFGLHAQRLRLGLGFDRGLER